MNIPKHDLEEKKKGHVSGMYLWSCKGFHLEDIKLREGEGDLAFLSWGGMSNKLVSGPTPFVCKQNSSSFYMLSCYILFFF